MCSRFFILGFYILSRENFFCNFLVYIFYNYVLKAFLSFFCFNNESPQVNTLNNTSLSKQVYQQVDLNSKYVMSNRHFENGKS